MLLMLLEHELKLKDLEIQSQFANLRKVIFFDPFDKGYYEEAISGLVV